MKPNPRLTAIHLLNAVIESGYSLNEQFDYWFRKDGIETQQAFIKELCFGTLRWYWQLNSLLDLLVKKPLKKTDADLRLVLILGLYQLQHTHVAEHAIVNETVKLVYPIGKQWAKGLVNAVLREFIRQKDNMIKKISNNEQAYFAHPQWFINRVKQAWPTQWQAIMQANNLHPPMVLRVKDRARYLQQLAEVPIEAEAIATTNHGVKLKTPLPVTQLPGYELGDVAVQDGAAQLAAELMQLAPGLLVLDACAAPGGKTVHMLELQPDLAGLIAIDNDEKRLAKVSENLQRHKVNAKLVHADVAEVNTWWDGQCFDRILLDAPCSATGVIRRHPDIKILRRETDINALAKQQAHLLETIWPTLKSGGRLVYSTCSILPEENQAIIKSFIASQPAANLVLEKQIFPGENDMDGFYYAVIQKMSA